MSGVKQSNSTTSHSGAAQRTPPPVRVRRRAARTALAPIVTVQTASEPNADAILARWGERLARLGRERLRGDGR